MNAVVAPELSTAPVEALRRIQRTFVEPSALAENVTEMWYVVFKAYVPIVLSHENITPLAFFISDLLRLPSVPWHQVSVK